MTGANNHAKRASRVEGAPLRSGTRRACLRCASLLFAAAPAAAQTSGAIEGTVVDAQGLSLPGATVTLAGEALIAPQSAVTWSTVHIASGRLGADRTT